MVSKSVDFQCFTGKELHVDGTVHFTAVLILQSGCTVQWKLNIHDELTFIWILIAQFEKKNGKIGNTN